MVDDSTLMREHIVASLRPLTELNFRHAANGLAALELLVQATFHLAVLALDMPDLGGLEVLEFVRAHAPLRSLPVVVVTSRSGDATRDQVLAAGGTRFVAKPFDPRALRAQVQDLLLGLAGTT